jgi:tetratricopeptide (TPR) repeat protein
MKKQLLFIALLLGNFNPFTAQAQSSQFNIVKGEVVTRSLPSKPIVNAKVWYNRPSNFLDIGTQYTLGDGRFTLKVMKDRQLQNIQVAAAAHGYEPLDNPKQVNFKLKSELDMILNLRPVDYKAKAVENLRSQNPELISPKILPPKPPASPNQKSVPKNEERSKPEQSDPPKPLLPNVESFVHDALETNASKLDVTVRIEIIVNYIQEQQESGIDLFPIPEKVSKPQLTDQQLYQTGMKAIVNGEDEEAMGILLELLSRSMAPRLRLKALVELADLLMRKNQPHNALNYLNEALQIMKDSESGYGELLPYCHYKLAVAANASMIDTSGLSSISLHRADSIMRTDSRHFRTASPRHRKLWHLIQLEKTRHATSHWEEENKRKFRRIGFRQNKAALRSLNEAYPKENNAYKGILVVEHADIMQRLRKPRKAIKLYRRASEINEDIYDSVFHPDMIRASLGAAMSFSDMGKSNKALEHIVKARTMAICTFPEFDPLLAKLYYLEALNRQSALPKSMALVPVELMEGQNQRLSELDSLYLRAIRGAEHTLSNNPDSLVRNQMQWLRMYALLGLINARSSEYQFRVMKNHDIIAIWNVCNKDAQNDKVRNRISLLEGKPIDQDVTKEFGTLYKQNRIYADSLNTVLQKHILETAKEWSVNVQRNYSLSRPYITENEKLGALLAESYLHKDWFQCFGIYGDRVTERALYREGQKVNRKNYVGYIEQIEIPEISNQFRRRILKVADKLMVGTIVPAEFNAFASFFHPNGELPQSTMRIGN